MDETLRQQEEQEVKAEQSKIEIAAMQKELAELQAQKLGLSEKPTRERVYVDSTTMDFATSANNEVMMAVSQNMSDSTISSVGDGSTSMASDQSTVGIGLSQPLGDAGVGNVPSPAKNEQAKNEQAKNEQSERETMVSTQQARSPHNRPKWKKPTKGSFFM